MLFILFGNLLALIILKATDFGAVAVRRGAVIHNPLNFHSLLGLWSLNVLDPEWGLYRIIILLTALIIDREL